MYADLKILRPGADIELTAYSQVTDAREAPPSRGVQRPSQLTRQGTRIISVDNVLQYASEIPSGQRRVTPTSRPPIHSRTPSGRHPLDPKLTGRTIPVAGKHMPSRSSKISEKLVLLPETAGSPPEDGSQLDEDEDAAPPMTGKWDKGRRAVTKTFTVSK